MTDVLPDAEPFGAAWVMLAMPADAVAAPLPTDAGADSDTRLGAADLVAAPVPDAAGALAVMAAGAADREAPPVAADTGADSAIEATEALAEPFTTVDADAEPAGAFSATNEDAPEPLALADTLAAGAANTTVATEADTAPSPPADQNPETIDATAADSGR